MKTTKIYNFKGEKSLENAGLPMFCRWTISIKDDKITIGCKSKTIKEWDDFFNSEEVYSTRRGSNEFKQIQACYEACKAYLLFLKK